MTKRDRDRRDDRRESQPDSEQGYRTGDGDAQEGESLTALKGILAKVASLLKPMQLTQEESIRLVEQMYESFLDMDVKLAGESDETRKSQVLSHIQNVVVRRDGDRLAVEYPPAQPEATDRGEAVSRETPPAVSPRPAVQHRPAAQPRPPVEQDPAGRLGSPPQPAPPERAITSEDGPSTREPQPLRAAQPEPPETEPAT